jgi:opacity protein-like surface antigen
MARILYLFIIVIFFSFSLFAQNQDDSNDSGDSEVAEVIDWAWKGKYYPYIEVTAGLAQFKHEKFEGTLPEEGLSEIKLGYSQIQQYEKIIWELDQRYVFGSYMDEDVAGFTNPAPGDFKANVSRFGFGNRLGYGYHLGPIELLPFSQSGLVWTRIRTDTLNDLSQHDKDILARYENVFRFGMATEGGVQVQLLRSIAFVASYELAVIYPRHIFWEWLGSYMIIQTGLGMVSTFSDDIMKSSPLFGPIIYFVLKNGLAYAFYQGVKEKMNWPFDSETPMTMENIKFGISITF